MKQLTALLFFLLISSTALYAQTGTPTAGTPTADTLRGRVPVAGPSAHLRGIVRAPGSSALGAVYFYGDKRLRSNFSLEVPFLEMNDPLVNRHFRAFRRFNTLSQVVGVVPLAYILLRGRGTGEYRYVLGGTIVASLALTIGGNVRVNRAVGRYNEVLLENRLGR